jgi:hypothetical protein
MASRRAAVAARPSAVPHKNPPALRPPVPLPSPAPRPSRFPCAPSPGWTSRPAFCCPRRSATSAAGHWPRDSSSPTSHRDVVGDDHQTAQLPLDIILRRRAQRDRHPGRQTQPVDAHAIHEHHLARAMDTVRHAGREASAPWQPSYYHGARHKPPRPVANSPLANSRFGPCRQLAIVKSTARSAKSLSR